jgi:hypothetical protein
VDGFRAAGGACNVVKVEAQRDMMYAREKANTELLNACGWWIVITTW